MSRPLRFILTGFKPFGAHIVNPSWEAARAMGESLGVEARLLDVTFEEAAGFATGIFATDESPVLFIHVGLAASRDRVSFEVSARNLRGLSPDNAGSHPCTPTPLVDEVVERRRTGVDVAALLERYEAGRPSTLPPGELSEDCGDYVCNALYYHSLLASEANAAPPRPNERSAPNEHGFEPTALFIHIPAVEAGVARALGTYLAGVVSYPTSDYLS